MSVRSIHQFAEKVALISDAASPVGRAVAIQLALNGSYVIGLFQHEGGSLDGLIELGTLAHALKIDPSTDAGAEAAATEVECIFGRLDLLVNCLKFRPESEFESVNEAVFTEMLRRNLGSVQFLTKAVFPLMKDRPKPKIVNVASATAQSDPIFGASQAGIISLSASMAEKFPSNFRVNCVEVNEAAGVAADDVARSVLFLLSSESAAMNGQVVKLG
jgi:NAD(P)-dependent dehydrogenase (short-subunit alcohol dehydrogenase family)